MIDIICFVLANREFITFLIGVGSFMAATAAMFVAIGANRIAKSALNQAILIADREQRDWRQRKWFDLYFKTNQAYDALERFKILYESTLSGPWGTQEVNDWNNLMQLFREAGAMAVVFPKNDAIDKLFAAVKLADRQEALSRERMSQIQEAMEAIRQKALVEPTVLG